MIYVIIAAATAGITFGAWQGSVLAGFALYFSLMALIAGTKLEMRL